MTKLKNIFRNSIFSFSFGDAYGENPKCPYIWTDDTSLSLALIDALNSSKSHINFQKKFYKNIKEYFEKGKFSPFHIPYKYGRTTFLSIRRKKGLKHERSCGNGSVMRALPVSFFFVNSSLIFRSKINHLQSSLTHSHIKVLVGCDIYVEFAHSLLKLNDKFKALKDLQNKMYILANYYGKVYKNYLEEYKEIFSANFYKTKKLKSSAYIVDTIRCIFYSVINSKNIMECLKMSSQFKGDRDTICAMSMGIYGILEKFDKNLFEKLKNNYIIKNVLNQVRI